MQSFVDLLPKLVDKDTPALLVFISFVSKSTLERKNYIHVSAHTCWRVKVQVQRKIVAYL